MTRAALEATPTEALLALYCRNRPEEAREIIVERMAPLVSSLARRFARPGVPVEDLSQTAWVALLGALERFDPDQRTRFSTYAVHCMVGEIKRYFRDRTWLLRPPRPMQELAMLLQPTEEQLCRTLGRPPTVREMAGALGVSEEHVVQAMEMARLNQSQGLDERREGSDGRDGLTVAESVGTRDARLGELVEYAPLREALCRLDCRRRKVVEQRYLQGRTQREVARELGVSQMHVSRLERSALNELRNVLKAA